MWVTIRPDYTSLMNLLSTKGALTRFARQFARAGILVACVAGAIDTSSAQSADQRAAPSFDQQILDKVTQFIAETALRELSGQATVRVVPTSLTLIADCGGEVQVFIPQGRALRPQTTVAVKCLKGAGQPVYLRADVAVEGPYVVAAQTINPNQIIRADMLEEKMGDVLKLPAHYRTSPERLIGRVATQRTLAGQSLRVAGTRGAHSVKRGDVVRIEARTAGLVITTQGEAMSQAEAGETVQLKIQNGKLVQAVLNQQGVAVTSF